jgi:hypothetical protein
MKFDMFETLVKIACFLFIIILAVFLVVCFGFWTDRNLDFWLSHFAGHSVNIPYWLSLIVSIAFNAIIIGANIVGEVCRFLV